MPAPKKKRNLFPGNGTSGEDCPPDRQYELEIDALAEKIKEANEIIAFCSDKLTKADKEIEKLLSEKRESEE